MATRWLRIAFLEYRPDTANWTSHLSFYEEVDSAPSTSYDCDIDSTRINGDTVWLYCHVTKKEMGYDPATHPRNLRVVFVGRYFHDATTGIHVLAGTIQATGRDPIVKALAHPNRSRFLLYRVDPWPEYRTSASATVRQ